jgi:O-antigen/teichoic acid export membrane protein
MSRTTSGLVQSVKRPIGTVPRRHRARPPTSAGSGRGRSTVGVALVGKAAELTTLALLITIVPRHLGPGAYGDFALALAIVTIGSLTLSLGGPEVMSRFVPATRAEERAAVARALAGRLAVSRAVLVLGAAVVGAVLAAVAPDRFPPLLTLLVLLALVLDGAATLSFQIALGLGRVGVWSCRYPVQNAVTIIAVVVLFQLGGTTAAIGALAIASGVALAIGTVAVAAPIWRAKRGVRRPEGAIRFGAVQAMSGLLNQFVHRGGVVAIAVLGGTSVQQGYAAVAIGVGLAVTYVVWQAFIVQLPSLAERWDADPEGVETHVRRLAWNTLAVLVPLAVAAELALGSVLPVALGDSFKGADNAFGPALALLPLAPLTAVASQASSLRLRPLARVWTTLAGAVTFAAIASAAVPAWGATGATAALLGGTVATVLASAFAFPRLATPQLVAASLAGSAVVLAIAVVR